MMPSSSHRQSGNVLFLILIAVALFAALSYAVTQSTRSGTGSTEREQAQLGSGALIQFPTALRSAVMRMMLSGNDVRSLMFNSPANFSSYTTTQLVFHPDGGGAPYQQARGEVMAAATDADWSFNAELSVPEVGSEGSGGNDLIAFLAGVNAPTCKTLNEKLGIGDSGSGQCGTYEDDIPEVDITDNADITVNMTNGYSFPSSAAQVIECAGGGANAFAGKASGCFFDPNLGSSGQFVFYSVLLER